MLTKVIKASNFFNRATVLKASRSSGRSRGYRAERELVIKLWRLGFAVLRAPASGARIRRADYPDIVAIRKGKVAVFEVKSRSSVENIYIKEEQVRKLLNFTERAGGKAYIAVKIPYLGWRMIPVSKLEKTPGGRYRLSKDLIISAKGMEQVLTDLGLIKPITNYMSRENYRNDL